MHLLDTLTVLQFLGGLFPIHATMAGYAAYTFYTACATIRCTTSEVQDQAIAYFFDICVIMWAHAIFALMLVARKQLRVSVPAQAFLKVTLTNLATAIYFVPFTYLMYH